ncbi:MAG: methyl-accepting chemotaxis protein, partial [Pseudomonadota bacterium]
TDDIARNVQHAATGTAEVSTNIMGVNSVASSTGASSKQVLSASEDLSLQAKTLQDNIVEFLKTIRAA